MGRFFTVARGRDAEANTGHIGRVQRQAAGGEVMDGYERAMLWSMGFYIVIDALRNTADLVARLIQ